MPRQKPGQVCPLCHDSCPATPRGSLRSSELPSGAFLFPQLLTLVTSASSHITHWWNSETTISGAGAVPNRPALQWPASPTTPRNPLFTFSCFSFFGKSLLFLFPEGGSERKRMSLFEALGILLQNRRNTGHPRCPPACPKVLVKEAMAPQSGLRRRQGCSPGNVASEPSAE